MKRPAFAELTRAFTEAEIGDFLALTGAPASDQVPEPLIGGLFSQLLGTRLPGPGTNWLKQELRFHAPARPGELLLARVEITRVRSEKHLLDLDCTCTGEGGRAIASGRALVLHRLGGLAP